MIELSNKFSVLATDSLEVAQQSPVLLKHGSREQISFIGKNKSKRKILLLGSSHVGGSGPMLQENLGSISISERWVGLVWIGLIWLRIWTIGGLL
jgi:hypothetical protein